MQQHPVGAGVEHLVEGRGVHRAASVPEEGWQRAGRSEPVEPPPGGGDLLGRADHEIRVDPGRGHRLLARRRPGRQPGGKTRRHLGAAGSGRTRPGGEFGHFVETPGLGHLLLGQEPAGERGGLGEALDIERTRSLFEEPEDRPPPAQQVERGHVAHEDRGMAAMAGPGEESEPERRCRHGERAEQRHRVEAARRALGKPHRPDPCCLGGQRRLRHRERVVRSIPGQFAQRREDQTQTERLHGGR